MKTTVLALLLAATVFSDTFAWAAPSVDAVVPRNTVPKMKKGRSHQHHEKKPTFKKGCNCQKQIIPNKLSKQMYAGTYECRGLL
ncbi:predicted protein [Plenodomus lingam JN3]|uniref:Uncharacterized protein n=1 Tax=Leptosphaeria maculans (strain JN3 / isolate v23.1.3 / race Av1-4-5-6-7-8) TaxID=985895 RepID=E5A5Y4_LEPMJ|nr:predicted protein [Plenodomus lingam JN3]CBX99029.1 predicted protein [Plenodomus lingam JN3]